MRVDHQMKNTMRRMLATGLIAIAASTSVGTAQTVGDDAAVPNTGLNLPTSLATFGKVEPTLRKAIAIVNGEIVTGTDVDQRLALIVVANGGKIAPDELDRLRVQVMRNLIDETLQIQEAKANKIEITKDELDQSFARVATQNLKRSPESAAKFLSEKGSSESSIKRQIHGELAWSRLLRRKVEPSISVSDAEVNAVIESLKASRGQPEYKVSEIYLSAAAENAAEVQANLQRMIELIKQGASFAAYARQFSEASSAAQGGDLGWVRTPMLPDALGQAVQEIAVGQIVGPIEVPGGYSVLYLTDKRQVLVADPRDAVLALRQLGLNFPAGMSSADAQAKATEFGQAAQTMGGCGGAEALATKYGAEVVDNEIQVKQLPPPLQDLLLGMQIGQSTPPFGSQAEGIRVLVLCGRDDPQVAGDPSFDEIMAERESVKVSKRAQRYLRDLRRDAVIDYR
jgi:peptidyl-prolyl cis-trans isomerase SurA